MLCEERFTLELRRDEYCKIGHWENKVCGRDDYYPGCCCSVTQSCPTLCNSMDCSMPGLAVPHHLLELAQVHVHCIGDTIQPSQPLTPSSPSALNLSQHQGLFQWVGCLHQVTKIMVTKTLSRSQGRKGQGTKGMLVIMWLQFKMKTLVYTNECLFWKHEWSDIGYFTFQYQTYVKDRLSFHATTQMWKNLNFLYLHNQSYLNFEFWPLLIHKKKFVFYLQVSVVWWE